MGEERQVPEFIDPVFTKTSPKRSFSLNRKRAFWLVFAKTGSIISGKGEWLCPTDYTECMAMANFWRTFHQQGKISPGWWGQGAQAAPLYYIYQNLPCLFQLRGQIHSPISPLPLYVLFALPYQLESICTLNSTTTPTSLVVRVTEGPSKNF